MRHLLFQASNRFSRDESGVHAIEFALIASFLMSVFLVALDIGLAIDKRMNLDHALRASAQYLMEHETDTDVLASRAREAIRVATYTATADRDQADIDVSSLSISVVKSCYCADADTALSCDTLCPNGRAPSLYFDYRASLIHAALFLPEFRVYAHQRFQAR